MRGEVMKNFVSSVSRLVRVAATVCLLTAFTGVGCCEESAMQFVALKNYAINDLALAPDGRILAATHAGAWEVDQDGRATPMTGTGLPRPMDKCFISGVAASGSGAVFIVVGSGGGGGVGVDGI